MIKEANKFAVILNARKSDSLEPAIVSAEIKAPALPTAEVPALSVSKSTRKVAKIVAPITPSLEPTQTNRAGGKGKSSDPNFKQVTAYIPKDLHTNASIALRLANQLRIDTEKEDFSELLTRLLVDWYEKQNYYKPNA